MERRSCVLAATCGAALAVLAACATKTTVQIPPRVDLYELGRIGLVEVGSDGPDALRILATQRLLQELQSAQPGVPILELGPEERLLAVVDEGSLDFHAVRSIGERYGVDTVLVGELEIREVKPRLAVGQGLSSLSAKAEVEGTLRIRLLEAEAGATLWSGSAQGSENVAHLSLATHRLPDFGASSTEDVHRRLVDGLVSSATRDFYPTYAQR